MAKAKKTSSPSAARKSVESGPVRLKVGTKFEDVVQKLLEAPAIELKEFKPPKKKGR